MPSLLTLWFDQIRDNNMAWIKLTASPNSQIATWHKKSCWCLGCIIIFQLGAQSIGFPKGRRKRELLGLKEEHFPFSSYHSYILQTRHIIWLTSGVFQKGNGTDSQRWLLTFSILSPTPESQEGDCSALIHSDLKTGNDHPIGPFFSLQISFQKIWSFSSKSIWVGPSGIPYSKDEVTITNWVTPRDTDIISQWHFQRGPAFPWWYQ